MPGTVVAVAALMHVLPAVWDLLYIRRTVNFQISNVVIVTERLETDAAESSDDARSLEAIQVNGPGFDDVHRDVVREVDKAQTQFFDIIAAGFFARRLHWGFLIRLAGDAPHAGIAEQIQHSSDMVDAHVVERAARRVALLHKGGRAIAIHVWPPAPPEPCGAGVIEFAQVAIVDEQLGRARFRFE